MAVVYIENDDDAYIAWLDRNATGFVANLGTGGKTRAMLHGARCGHLYPPESGKMHTGTYPKACAQNRDDVERWTRGPLHARALFRLSE